jgi:Phosphotransferase enzyme family
LQAVGKRELAWLRKYGRPRFPQNPIYKALYGHKKSDPAVQIRALKEYLRASQCIVPDDSCLNRPTLRHPDLSPSNIFVSKEGEISGLIDWEGTTILPLFLQARIPEHFQNFGDKDSENFRQPQLPANFASLSGEEKEAEEELYRRRQLHFFYLGATSQTNSRHYDALFFDPEARRARLYQKARVPWEGDNISLKAQLIKTVQNWPSVRSKTAVKCPINYSEDEVKECLALAAQQKELDKSMQVMHDRIGVSVDGWVSNDEYEATKQRADEIKAQFMATAETEAEKREFDQNWPFQDHEEVE